MVICKKIKEGISMKNKKLTTIYTKAIVKIARKAAAMEANSSCPCIGFQPEIPESVKKLSKIKK